MSLWREVDLFEIFGSCNLGCLAQLREDLLLHVDLELLLFAFFFLLLDLLLESLRPEVLNVTRNEIIKNIDILSLVFHDSLVGFLSLLQYFLTVEWLLYFRLTFPFTFFQ